MKSYEVPVDGLAEAVASVPPSDGHAALLEAIKRLEGLSEAFLATTRDGTWLSQRKVLSADGTVLHDDHRLCLRAELDHDGGRADRTAERLAALDLRLSE